MREIILIIYVYSRNNFLYLINLFCDFIKILDATCFVYYYYYYTVDMRTDKKIFIMPPELITFTLAGVYKLRATVVIFIKFSDGYTHIYI